MDQLHKRIMVIEDDKATQAIVTRILKSQSYSVSAANNGKEAIHAIETQEPHLIVLDVMMPELSGLDVLRWLKFHHPHIPVIMLSIMEEYSKVAREAKALGVFDFISKPPDYQNLLSKIERALNPNPSAA